jgi:nucleoid-associated protein YgaU
VHAQAPAAAASTDAIPATPATAHPTYTVRRHDTLWAIAEKYLGNPLRYTEIVALNTGVVGPDNEITPGDVLAMPQDTTGLPGAHDGHVDVTVHEGDTLSGLVEKVTGDQDWRPAWQANNGRSEPGGQKFADPNLMQPGWTVSMPTDSLNESAPPPTTPPQPKPGSTSTPAPPTPTDTVPAQPPTRAEAPAPAPRAPATSSPRSPAATAPAPATDAPEVRHAASDAPVAAFAAGGGLLLAGVSLTVLVAYRRRQFRRRRPGRTTATTDPGLIRMERAVLSAGRPAQADVTWLDQSLRSLVQGVAQRPGGRLPDVIAVRMTADELALVLTGPTGTAPAPWRVSEDQKMWTIQRSDALPYDPEQRGSYFAPFPTLASVGYSTTGEHWLLDLERIAALSLTGDAERCMNLARFLAAELAHNTWSEMLQVTLVGFGRELVAANPDRLAYTEDLAGAVKTVTRRFDAAVEGTHGMDTTVLDGRLHNIVADLWAPNVLLIAPHLAGDQAGLDRLLEAMKTQQTRTTVALVLADDPDRAEATRWQLHVDEFGRVRMPALGLELVAEQIPADEAAQLAQMLALAARCEEDPIPAAHGQQPWDKYADACGNLTVAAAELAEPAEARETPRHTAGVVPVLHRPDEAPWRNSVLPLSPQTYLAKAATTEEDVRALGPVVNDEIRALVEQSDPDLDADLEAWHAPDCPRPRFTVLGNVKVRAQGSLPDRSPQERLHTEAGVYLATRSTGGVLSPVFAQAMWPNDPNIVGKDVVRQLASSLRKWFGQDPVTGRDYLPADLRDGRTARYCIEGALVDGELFRRLRIRAEARGPDGNSDLWRALELVQGPPFHELPMPDRSPITLEPLGPGGWLWLTDADIRLDSEYAAMVVDAAHTVAIRHLGADEPELAAKAAQVALRSGTARADVPLLDLVCACMAMDKEGEAEGYVQQLLHNNDVGVVEDLDPRTAQVLFRLRKHWADRAS